MTQPAAGPTNLKLQGGAAIVAPVTAFPGGIPGNALIVLPVTKPSDDLEARLKEGPFAVTQEQMWALLGFRGPAVQVQDGQGRPMTIGLDDLLDGLRDHYNENKGDLSRARLFANELMKYARFEEAEKVLGRIVATGGGGEDWMGLGVAQLQQKKFQEAEGTLKGAKNLLSGSAFPNLHLAKVYRGLGNRSEERAAIEGAIAIDPTNVDAWAVLFVHVRDFDGEEAALGVVTELANTELYKKSAAPFVALQGLYANQEETRDRALEFAKVAVERDENNVLALISYTALLGQSGNLEEIVKVLSRHEAKMTTDVRLAHNYFEALMHKQDIQSVTRLLNTLAASPNREVKQFAIERSRLVAQFLQQQQAQVAQAGRSSGLLGPNGQPLG